MKFGLHSYHFFMVPRAWFLLVRLACLYGCMNWCLAQAQQLSYVGSSQSFPPMRGDKARPRTGFHFDVQKRCVPEFSGASGKEASLGE